jgi:hypothetical protein
VDYEAAEPAGGFAIRGLGEEESPPMVKDSARAVDAVLVPGQDSEVLLRATGLALPTVVVTRRGRPLAGAQVRLEPSGAADDPFGAMRYELGGVGAPTSADGSVRLQPVEPGDYHVVVNPGGGFPERRERAALHSGEQRVEFDVRGGRVGGIAESSSGELRGAVAHLERAPVEGGGGRTRTMIALTVGDAGDGPEVHVGGGPGSTRCEVDSSGRYVFEEVPAGEWIVRVRAPGHAEWTSRPFTLGEEQSHELAAARLSAGGTLRGVHRGAQDGGGFLILLDEQGRQAGVTQPGPDGAYAFRDLASGSYTLLAPPGYRSDPIEVKDGATVTHDVPGER